MTAQQILGTDTTEADCYFDHYVNAEGPAVAYLYPDANFMEIYAKAEKRLLEEWIDKDFAEVAIAREIERLRSGDDAQFRDLFERAEQTERASIESTPRSGLEIEASRQARKKLTHLKGRRTTIRILGSVIVPPHRLEDHKDGVDKAVPDKGIRELIDMLGSWDQVHEGIEIVSNDRRLWPESGKAMAEVLNRNRRVLEQEGVTWDYLSTNNTSRIPLDEIYPVS
jgi:hypothetical protein